MDPTDAHLVDLARVGDRDAFAEIVARYQTLVCSISFSSTGNLNASEELAQEAFVAAWKTIGSLREPAKLRQWLCGIVRNLANNQHRRRSKDILSNAKAIESEHHVGDGPDPVGRSIAQEEMDLLNRTLAAMPERYREPMVLYYREQQSVSRVAELLELTPSAVKQRLARGRDMLRQDVAAIVERGLLSSAPGRAFTLGVLAALPIMSGSAKAATVSMTTAKGISAMNAANVAGISGAILGPIAGLLGGWFGYRMSMNAARSDRERDFIRSSTRWLLCWIGLFAVGLGLLIYFGRIWSERNPSILAFGIVTLSIGYASVLGATVVWSNRRIRRIREETGTTELPPTEVAAKASPGVKQFQYARTYESKLRLLGIPLLSVRFSGTNLRSRQGCQPAIGWLAIGDFAYGLIAIGSCAVGGIAFGAIGIGVFSFGGLALGAIAFGGCAVGWGACGGLAIGWVSFGGVALAWKAAIGGMAVGHDFGLGGVVVAEQANTDAAKAFVEQHPFFGYAGMMMNPWSWWIAVGLLLAPMLIMMRLVPAEDSSNHLDDTEEQTS